MKQRIVHYGTVHELLLQSKGGTVEQTNLRFLNEICFYYFFNTATYIDKPNSNTVAFFRVKPKNK